MLFKIRRSYDAWYCVSEICHRDVMRTIDPIANITCKASQVHQESLVNLSGSQAQFSTGGFVLFCLKLNFFNNKPGLFCNTKLNIEWMYTMTSHHIPFHHSAITMATNIPYHKIFKNYKHTQNYWTKPDPTWEWARCHRIFYKRQDWNVCAVVSSWKNMRATTRTPGWNAGRHVETRYDVTFILKVR